MLEISSLCCGRISRPSLTYDPNFVLFEYLEVDITVRLLTSCSLAFAFQRSHAI